MASEYDIDKIFEEMESYLLSSMHRNLERHLKEEAKEGFNWEQWQALQLESLNQYRKTHSKYISKQTGKVRGMIESLLKKTNADARMSQETTILDAIRKGFKVNRPTEAVSKSFFRLNERKMHALIQGIDKDIKNASVAMLRRADDEYRKVVYKSQMFSTVGTATPQQAVDMATKEFLSKGINCIQYRDGRMVNIKSYAQMAIRTANKRAALIGDGLMREEWGIHTVRVSQYGMCSPTCRPWQGKVYIDDVYRNSKVDEQEKRMGYPMLSTAIKGHLFHPNCKHRLTTFFPGISKEPKKIEYTHTSEGSALLQRKNYIANRIAQYERLRDYSFDEDNKFRYERKVIEWRGKREELSSDEWLPFSTPKPLQNDNETVERMYSSLKINESNNEFINFVKLNLKSIPENDIDFLKRFNISVIQSLEGSYFMDGNIYLDTNNPNYVLAHEMGHAAETFLFENNEVIKKIKEEVFSSSTVLVKSFRNEYYYVFENERFVRPYQGRTYIKYSKFDTKDELLKKISPDSLEEYISVGYETFVKNPKLLQKKDLKLYNFFKTEGLS